MGLDIFVVFIYIAGMLALGWLGMRRATSREEFLVAGRNLGPGFYMGTMAATVLGGASTVGTVKLGYVYGISGFWLCAALGCGILVLNLFMAKPLLKLKVFTVTQVLERRYNTLARRTSALVMLMYAVMISVTSVLAIATVMQVLFELPFWLAVVIGGGVVVLYSAVGGMWSLTLTDIVQFMIKTIGLMFILLPICLYRVGGWEQLAAKLPASYFSFTAIGGETIITYFVIYFFGILIGQDIWQRVFTARSEGVARYAGSIAGIYCIVYGLICAAIGMATKVLLPDLAVPANAFASMVKEGLPDGVRGLVIAAALAAMMSTASAALLAASTTLTEDLSGRDGCSLWTNRIVTLLVGVLVLVLAMLVSDVISALTLAYNLLVAGMLVPLLGAIFWPRATTAGAISSMVLGCGTAIMAMISYGLDSNLPIYQSLVVSVLSFVLVSLCTRREHNTAATF
ncbi:putative sodium-solute symporter [Aquitalea magnusonii]|uniref:Putative sodium-solute symporter n=1 Tax=Aquitalea magnusonii TaxID=332411 RepID=A0A3G9GJQ6_9NEIS|nr:sodium:solute symporter [Aquitalea magnusonii]BBF87634.1 putative sodium-solute symporter [Aquitalea magnusonii]